MSLWHARQSAEAALVATRAHTVLGPAPRGDSSSRSLPPVEVQRIYVFYLDPTLGDCKCRIGLSIQPSAGISALAATDSRELHVPVAGVRRDLFVGCKLGHKVGTAR